MRAPVSKTDLLAAILHEEGIICEQSSVDGSAIVGLLVMIYFRCLGKMRKFFALTVWSILGTVMLTTIVGSAAAAADDVASTSLSIPASTSAAQLRQRYEALRTKLANSPFKRPLVIESRQGSSDIKGEIYAVTKHPFAIVNASLGSAQSWCEILILHLNTKYCRIQDDHAGSTVPDGDSAVLLLNVGKKFDQPLADSFRLIFDWRAVQRKADFLQVVMSAESGPLGTHNYRIVLEAVPINADTTFVHLSYESLSGNHRSKQSRFYYYRPRAGWSANLYRRHAGFGRAQYDALSPRG